MLGFRHHWFGGHGVDPDDPMQIVKKNVIENIVPTVMALKRTLEQQHSPVRTCIGSACGSDIKESSHVSFAAAA